MRKPLAEVGRGDRVPVKSAKPSFDDTHLHRRPVFFLRKKGARQPATRRLPRSNNRDPIA
jgi:hypothetical protein